MPLAKKRSPALSKSKSPTVVRMPVTITGGHDDSDSDIPLAAAKLSKEKAAIMKEQRQTADKLQAQDKKRKPAVKKEESESDDDVPLSKRRAAVGKPKPNGVKKEPTPSDDDDDDDVPLAKKRATKAVAAPKKAAAAKKEPTAVKKEVKGKGRAKKSETPATVQENEEEEEDDEDDTFKWWENPDTMNTIKWTTLEHNGVLFPPPYEPLPKNVKMKYNGVEVTLPVQAEEVAGFFGAMLDSPHASNPKFCENFFNDFREILAKNGGARDPSGKVRFN